MKHLIFKITSLIIVSLLTVFIVSCDKTSETDVYKGTTTIRLRVPMLDVCSRAADDWNEDRINTLRVIILSKNAGSINKLFRTEDLSSSEIRIDDVPVGIVEMYVIANEASLGKNYDDLSELQKDVQQEVKKVLITDANRAFFPKRRSEIDINLGLPMSWMNQKQEINTPTSGMQVINVLLVRSVSKLNILMQNKTQTDMSVTQIRLGTFFANSLYLFETTNLDVPNNTVYEKIDYNNLENILIQPGATKELACYIYPSFAWKSGTVSPYTIGFTANNSSYNELPFIYNGQPMNAIARNTQVNIYASLVGPSKLDVTFSVNNWEEEDINVPSFN